MEIYWIENKQRKGPVSVSEIISLLEAEDITPETKGWHQGCAQWLPLHELPALSSYFHPIEPDEEQADLPPIPNDIPSEASPPVATIDRSTVVPTPVLRLWARILDLLLYAVVWFGCLNLFHAAYNPYFFSTLAWIPMFLIEAWLISRWGTTPGKWLLGIRVITFEEKKLTFLRSLARSMQVYIFGMGLVTTIFTPIMMFISWLSLRKRGTTVWDQRAQSCPLVTSPVRMERILIAAVLILILIETIFFFIAPWMPDLVAQGQEAASQLGLM